MENTSFKEVMKQGYIEMGEINLNIANGEVEEFDITKFIKEGFTNT